MTKATYKASSDIALVKYWGKKDEELRLPENGSISMKLDGLDTITSVEFGEKYKEDEIIIEGRADKTEVDRVVEHLDRIRKLANTNLRARVVSKNSFPKGTGLSSSGSGLTALTMAATKALAMELSEKDLSILARVGSGTACRCVCGGFVEWKDGEDSDSSYSETIFPADYWDIRDVVVVVDEGMKKISSTKGHTTAQSSILFGERQKRIKAKIVKLKEYIKNKDFSGFGELVEREALEFHSVLLTSNPPLVAWYPGTMEVIHAVNDLRENEIECYFTINTGFNVHVLTLPIYEEEVKNKMRQLSLVKNVLQVKIGDGPNEIKEHLF